jgi:hypothetical protein
VSIKKKIRHRADRKNRLDQAVPDLVLDPEMSNHRKAIIIPAVKMSRKINIVIDIIMKNDVVVVEQDQEVEVEVEKI